MPVISIVVPIYNVGKYIRKCIDSLIEQSVDDPESYEVILVDDGSTDNSGSLCDEYSNKYQNIQTIHQINQGPTRARKTGASKACGDYIMAVDGDDYIDRDLVKAVIGIIAEYHPDIVSYGYKAVDERGNELKRDCDHLPEGYYAADKIKVIEDKLMYDRSNPHLHGGSIVGYTVWSKAIKRELYVEKQMQVPDEYKYGEDMAVVIPAICSAKSFYSIKAYGYNYVQRGSSIIHTFDSAALSKFADIVDFLKVHAIGISEENIESNFFRVIMAQFMKAACNYTRYENYQRYVQAMLQDKRISTAIDGFNSNGMSPKAKGVIFLMKKRKWRVFWIMSRKVLKN